MSGARPSAGDVLSPDTAGPAPLACFHCGQPVPQGGRWRVRIDDVPRDMCCAGCQAVAQAIVDAGLDDYYRHRSAPASGPSAVPPELASLAVYDEPEVQARFVRGDGGTQEATLLLEGMRCGACVWLVERSLAAQPGVVSASVNFATERAVVRWDPARTRLSSLLSRVAEIGYRALPYDARQREAQLARTTKSLFRRLFVAGIGMMQVMMYAFPAYTARPGDIDWEFEHLMRWASLLLTIPVVLYSAAPFFAGAWRDLRARSLGMDVPVALGIAAAFAASAWATFAQRGDVYFDSVTMFVFLLLGARYLEWIARRRASRAVDALAAALPERARRLACLHVGASARAPSEAVLAAAAVESVPAERLAPGDLIRVDTGERVPVDAAVVTGETAVDQSLLTGESRAVPRGVGDEIAGGATIAGSPVFLRVLRASADSTLSTIERLIERAALEKPAVATLADRVASGFVLALLALAATVFVAWLAIDADRALPIAIAVLVVSCPCALSLATPAALAAATGAATRHGALIASGVALETIAQATDVVFDKTGTLTEGRPKLARIDRFAGDTEDALLGWCAALEAGSPHPLAAALVDAARARPAGPPATAVVHAAGRGVEGDVGARRLRLGSASFAAEWAPLPAGDVGPDSEVWLVEHDRALARFALRDALRDDARPTVDALRDAGLRVHLLSGDRAGAVDAAAAELGIGDVRADASPGDKLAYVRDLQAAGRRVAMVGDGINDAPVLASADVSVAVGQASALAKTSADIVLLSNGIALIPELHGLARRTRRVIAQNLAWAGAYNAVAIPAAALGWVPPWLAAVGMSTSSLLVVGNALRLRIVSRRPGSA